MSEWKEVRLGDLCHKVCSGGTPKSTCSVYYEGGTIPWLNTKEVNYNRIYETESHITEEGLNNSSAKLIDANAVVVAMYGATAGRVAIAKVPMTTNQACCNLMIDSSKADYDYIFYYLSNNYKQLLSMANGAAQQNLNAQVIKDYIVSLPPLDTQHQIASILSALDDKIAVNRRICENLESQAQALFKHWFIDFAPFKDGKFVESELGMIPEGWRVGTLGDVVNQVTDKVGEKNNVRVLSPINIGKLVLSDEFFTKQVYSKSISKYIIVNPNDFAYNPARVNIGSIGRNEYEFMGCVSPVYVVFHCQEHYHYFIDFFRHGSKFKKNVEKLAIGGVRQTLRYEDLARIPLVIPPTEVIISFNDIYKKMYAVIIKKNQESSRLSTLRDTLLPKLMSGQIKV